MAMSDGNITKLRWFLDNGFDVNQSVVRGLTALYCAAMTGRIDIVRILLENGADVSKRSVYGETPLFSAIFTTDNEINAHNVVKMLLDHGADVNVYERNGWTPLMKAVQVFPEGTLVLQAILCAMERSPAEMSTINAVSVFGHTAVHIAISSYSLDALKILLLAGADCTISNRIVRPALQFAETYETIYGVNGGLQPMSKLLSDVACELQYKQNQRVFALGGSMVERNSSIVKTLSHGIVTAMFRREADQHRMFSEHEKLVDAIATKQLINSLKMQRGEH